MNLLDRNSLFSETKSPQLDTVFGLFFLKVIHRNQKLFTKIRKSIIIILFATSIFDDSPIKSMRAARNMSIIKKLLVKMIFSQTWHAQRQIAHLVPGEILEKVNGLLIFLVHVSKSLWKRSLTIKKLLGEKVIWFEEHTKIQGTFKTLLQMIETQRMAPKCQ